MTLSTHVYVLDEVNAHEAFHFCRHLLGCRSEHAFTDAQEREYRAGGSSPKPGGHWTLANVRGQGLPAWLLMDYRPDGSPLRTPEQAMGHDEDCESDCDGSTHPVACWLDIDFDTAYGHQDAHGGCGDLHARLVAELGQWLDAKGIGWAWRNEFTGDIHGGPDRYERLADLCSGGAAATNWFTTSVLPAVRSRLVAGTQ